MLKEKELITALVKLIQKAEFSLPKDIEEKLKEAHQREENQLAKIQLEQILKNIKVAGENSLAICQDTGLLSFYVRVGKKPPVGISTIRKAIKEAVMKATEKIPLRENTVEPLSRENFGNNLGKGMPLIHWKFSPEDYIEITVFPKGAGSENMTQFKMLNPTEGKEGIKKFVLKKVKEAGGQPCPPIILGIGVGGSSEKAMELAKLSLLQPLTEKSKESKIAHLEEEILNEVNELGIGVMGLGGSTTCLGVKINYASTHTASLPVALNLGCWATRRATLKISEDKIKFL